MSAHSNSVLQRYGLQCSPGRQLEYLTLASDSHSRWPSRRRDQHPSVASLLELRELVLERHVRLSLGELHPELGLRLGLVNVCTQNLPNVRPEGAAAMSSRGRRLREARVRVSRGRSHDIHRCRGTCRDRLSVRSEHVRPTPQSHFRYCSRIGHMLSDWIASHGSSLSFGFSFALSMPSLSETGVQRSGLPTCNTVRHRCVQLQL